MRSRRRAATPKVSAEGRIQNVPDERRFSAARHAGDTDQSPQRNLDVHMLQVVLRGPENRNLAIASIQ